MLPVAMARHCNMLCTSSFMDDIMFSYHGTSEPESSTRRFPDGSASWMSDMYRVWWSLLDCLTGGKVWSMIDLFLLLWRSKDVDELEVKVGLDQYTVPSNIRTAVNHSVDSATAASSTIAKDISHIRFLLLCSLVYYWLGCWTCDSMVESLTPGHGASGLLHESCSHPNSVSPKSGRNTHTMHLSSLYP